MIGALAYRGRRGLLVVVVVPFEVEIIVILFFVGSELVVRIVGDVVAMLPRDGIEWKFTHIG